MEANSYLLASAIEIPYSEQIFEEKEELKIVGHFFASVIVQKRSQKYTASRYLLLAEGTSDSLCLGTMYLARNKSVM